jgi:hypothetical protein
VVVGVANDEGGDAAAETAELSAALVSKVPTWPGFTVPGDPLQLSPAALEGAVADRKKRRGKKITTD